jgi:hypothetical protein
MDLPSFLGITMVLNNDIHKDLPINLISTYFKVDSLNANLIHWINFSWIFFSIGPCLSAPCPYVCVHATLLAFEPKHMIDMQSDKINIWVLTL